MLLGTWVIPHSANPAKLGGRGISIFLRTSDIHISDDTKISACERDSRTIHSNLTLADRETEAVHDLPVVSKLEAQQDSHSGVPLFTLCLPYVLDQNSHQIACLLAMGRGFQ